MEAKKTNEAKPAPSTIEGATSHAAGAVEQLGATAGALAEKARDAVTEVRRDVEQVAGEGGHRLQETAQKARHGAKEITTKVIHAAQEVAQKVTHRAKEASSTAEHRLQELAGKAGVEPSATDDKPKER